MRKNRHHGLTEQEWKVLGWSKQGLGRAEVAERMGITVGTVNAHLHRVFEELAVHSLPAAMHRVDSLTRERRLYSLWHRLAKLDKDDSVGQRDLLVRYIADTNIARVCGVSLEGD